MQLNRSKKISNYLPKLISLSINQSDIFFLDVLMCCLIPMLFDHKSKESIIRRMCCTFCKIKSPVLVLRLLKKYTKLSAELTEHSVELLWIQLPISPWTFMAFFAGIAGMVKLRFRTKTIQDTDEASEMEC